MGEVLNLRRARKARERAEKARASEPKPKLDLPLSRDRNALSMLPPGENHLMRCSQRPLFTLPLFLTVLDEFTQFEYGRVLQRVDDVVSNTQAPQDTGSI